MARTRKIRRGGQNNTKKNPKAFNLEEANRKARAARIVEEGKKKKEEGTMARRAALVASVAETVYVSDEGVNKDIMRLHMYADMIHDHGMAATANPQASRLVWLEGPPAGGVITDEDAMYQYIIANYPAVNADIRRNNEVTFQLDNATNFFPGQPIFAPFNGVPNIEVGVVQDAGIVLYKIIGATNLITFGSVLDQAGKPTEDKYWFEVDEGQSLVIPSDMLGFNPARVKDITITKFTGKSVMCTFQYMFPKPGEAWTLAGTLDGPLALNSISGDFQSNATVKAERDSEKKFKLMIGKALGDALQVVSLMPVSAPFIRLGTIANSLDGKENRLIRNAILNTGDRLNHARAYAFGVGSVYTAPKRHGVFTCKYMPGVQADVTPAQMFNVYFTYISDLIKLADKDYEALSSSFDALSRSFTQDNSMKSGEALIPGEPGFTRIRNIYAHLLLINETIRAYVMGYFMEETSPIFTVNAEAATPENVQTIKEIYQRLLTNAPGLMPSHTSTTKKRGENNIIEAITLCRFKGVLPRSTDVLDAARQGAIDTYIKLFRPSRVSVIVPNGTTIPGGIKGTLVFYVSNVYQLVGRGGNIGSPYNKIFVNVTIPGRDTAPLLLTGNALERAKGDVFGQQYENNIDIPLPVIGGGMIGGEMADFDSMNDALDAFVKYAASQGVNPYEYLKKAFATRLQNPYSIIDNLLFEEVFGARVAYVGESAKQAFDQVEEAVKTLMVIRRGGPGPGVETRSMYQQRLESYKVHTDASLFFNEFSLAYNASIIEDFGDPEAENDYYKELMKAMQEIREKRLVANILFDFASRPVAGGGLSIEPTSSVTHVGGQRVPAANLNIDATKSFVRSVGRSPSSEAK